MTTKSCKFCAEEIQDAAVLCKHCGKSQNYSQRNRKFLVVFVVLCVISTALLAYKSTKSLNTEKDTSQNATNDLTVILDFNDEGVTDVLALESYLNKGDDFPGQAMYYTCGDAAFSALSTLFGDPLTNPNHELAMGTIMNGPRFKAQLLKGDSSLYAISDKPIPQIHSETTCSLVYKFRNVELDGLPLVFDQSKYLVDPIAINPNEIVNGEIHFSIQHLKLKTFM